MKYAWVGLVLTLVASPAVAQNLAPLGDQFQVNTRTIGDQVAGDVVPRPGGAFLVVWEGDLASGIDPSIGGRRFDESGMPEGNEFQVNSNGTIQQRTPAVAIDQAGRVGVVFRVGLLDFPTKMQARVSNNMSIFLELDFGLNDIGNPYSLDMPAIGASDQDEFVAVWWGANFDTADTVIQGRRLMSSGTPAPILDEIDIASADGNSGGFVVAPSVAVAQAGNFVVAWMELDPNPPDFNKIQARRYDASNNPVGDVFQIDTDVAESISPVGPSIDCDAAGNFVVVWSAASSSGASFGGSEGADTTFNIRARRFNASGTALSGEFVVNQFTENTQDYPDIAMRDDGEFVVTWTSNGSSGDDQNGQSVQARHFAADGTPLGSDIQVNSYTTGNQLQSAVAALDPNTYVVVWQGESGDDNLGIAGRRLGLVVEESVFSDGFESAMAIRQ